MNPIPFGRPDDPRSIPERRAWWNAGCQALPGGPWLSNGPFLRVSPSDLMAVQLRGDRFVVHLANYPPVAVDRSAGWVKLCRLIEHLIYLRKAPAIVRNLGLPAQPGQPGARRK